MRHSHDVVEVEECAVAHALINRILEEIRRTLPRSSSRGLKGIEITVPCDGNQGIVIWHAGREGFGGRTPFQPPEMAGAKTSVAWGPYSTPESAPPREEPLALVMPAAAGIRYYLYPGVFSQVNPLQNSNLIAKVTEWAGLSAEDDVLDLFCGMGNLTLPLAREAGTVLGIEQHPLSVDNAVFNAAANGINNVTFLAQPVSVGLDNLIRDKKRFDVVVVDPPRSGCSEIVGRLARLGCSRLLYVSCDPATLSRDACLLKSEGLDLLRSQPIDMFPQTYHIESLTLFGKKTT